MKIISYSFKTVLSRQQKIHVLIFIVEEIIVNPANLTYI